MTIQCNCPDGRHTPECYEREIERLKAQTPEGCQKLEEENKRLRARVETLQLIVQSCPSCGPVWHALHEEPLPWPTDAELRADIESSAEDSTEPHSA